MYDIRSLLYCTVIYVHYCIVRLYTFITILYGYETKDTFITANNIIHLYMYFAMMDNVTTFYG